MSYKIQFISYDLRDLSVLHLGRGAVAGGRRDGAGQRLEVRRLGGLDQVLLSQQLLQVVRGRLQGRRGELRRRRQQRGRVGAPRAAVHLARPASATAATYIRTATGDREYGRFRAGNLLSPLLESDRFRARDFNLYTLTLDLYFLAKFVTDFSLHKLRGNSRH